MSRCSLSKESPTARDFTDWKAVDSEHTQAALEALHPNIAVMRHPDHIPSGQVLESEIASNLKNMSFKTMDLAKLGHVGLEVLYGAHDDDILYWAHHQKLCMIDGTLAFLGGLDLCFGRWDVYSHPIADAHPNDLEAILFPGQDYNNARIFDFADLSNPFQNKLKRTESSRIGWSDLSVGVQGPILEDLKAHFVQRWNYIYDEKYDVKKDARYKALALKESDVPDGYYELNGKNVRPVHEVGEEDDDPNSETRENKLLGFFHLPGGPGSIYDKVKQTITGGPTVIEPKEQHQDQGGISVQLVRSCTQWSNGVTTEVTASTPYLKEMTNWKLALYCKCLHPNYP